MILCDREIQALIEDRAILIEDEHGRPPVKDLWTSTAVDLTLQGVLLEWTPGPSPTGQPNEPRPAAMNFNVQAMMDDVRCTRRITIDPNLGFRLTPGKFVLGFTREGIRFPTRSRIAARVEGKSSLARLGIGIHVTAPTIHAGFGEKTQESPRLSIQLEIFNLGNWTVVLDAGMAICQLILEEVRELALTGYRGQFSEQRAFTAPGGSASGPAALTSQPSP